jgi:hypothetical protein
MVIFFSKFRKNYKELSGLPKVWIRMKCTICQFSPKCVSVLGKEKCAEKTKYIWTKCLLMFCFNPKFSSYGGNMNNLKNVRYWNVRYCKIRNQSLRPRIRILLPKKVYRRERMKIGRNKNEKKRNTIEYKQIPVAD